MSLTINQAGSWERMCQSVYQTVDLYMDARKARKRCRRQLVKIKGGYRGSNSLFHEQVTGFWKQYGIKPNKMWYDLYGYKDAAYDPRYIPEDLYWRVIYPTLNKTSFRHAYTDKCFYKQLFPYLRQPRTILRNSNHCFYDDSGKLISFRQAKSLLESEKQFVLKPAIYSGEGADIFFYDRDNNPNLDFEHLIKSYGRDFIIQDIVKQHEILASIHPSSLNTIRVISFLFQEEVHISSAILRMGVGGSRLDNISVGGIACPIHPDGRLENKGIDKRSQWVTVHPSGAVFSEIRIPSYERVLSLIRRAHKDIPYFRIIGWDFAIDEVGEPVFIEYNGAPGLNQISCGPMFGELTEPILDAIFLKEMKLTSYIATN